MSYSKLIHEYLDGQTNMVREDVLFAELAKNPDLRIEFNQQVQLQNVAMADMRTISPPAESTNAIFSSLGFSIPSKEYLSRISSKPANALQLSKTGSAFLKFWQKYAVTVAAIFLTAGLTTSVFMLTDDRFASIEEPVLAQKVEKEIPVVSSQEKSEKEVSNSNHNGNFAAAYVNSIVEDVSTNSVELNEPVSIAKSDINSLNSSQNIDIKNAYRNDFSANSVPQEMIDPLADLFNFKPARNFNDGNLAIIVSYPNSNANNVKVNNNLTGGFEYNFDITILKKIGENWYIGGSFGKEDIAMNFNRDLYGEQLNYQISPSIWFFGLTAKYSPNLDNLIGLNLSQFIRPYAQLFAGSSNMAGGIGSGQIGLTLTPYNTLAMHIGYEFKTYVYKVDQSYGNTNKNGFVFGAGLSF